MPKQKRKASISDLRSNEKKLGYMFASPWLIGFLVFGIFPLFMSFYLGFTKYNMVGAPEWRGLDNYRILFTNDDLFWQSLGNTIYHVGLSVPLGLIVGISLALLLNNKIKGIGIYRTLFYLPNVVSLIALSFLWLWLFQPNFGIINEVLDPVYKLLGIEPFGWYQDPATSKITIILMGMWTAGGSMVIYLAQMQDIPTVYYEAASIDGASTFQKIRKITLPLMTPSIFLNAIMGIILGFQVFVEAHIMTGGGPAKSTYYYGYYLFDQMINNNNMGRASAMAWILLIITLIITLLALTMNRFVFYMGEDD